MAFNYGFLDDHKHAVIHLFMLIILAQRCALTVGLNPNDHQERPSIDINACFLVNQKTSLMVCQQSRESA